MSKTRSSKKTNPYFKHTAVRPANGGVFLSPHGAAMRILFIKLRHIGDSLLLTPTLVATKEKFPHAEIWVLVRESWDAILAGCPEIDRLLTTANPDASKRTTRGWLSDLRLAALLHRTKFDHVFELTDSDRLLDEPPPELARRGCGEVLVSGGIDAGDSARARAHRLR